MTKRTAILPMMALLLLAACGEDEPAAIPELSVAEASAQLEAGAVAVDANSDATRAERGVVPGARLLTSSSRYEASELPSDPSTALIFYCANTQCSASDGAAERAREHGYENVSVMRAGIAGWVDAGNETETPRS